MSEDKIINATKNYQILIEDREYVVQKLTKIDPTKSPKFNPDEDDPTVRYEWKDDSYFSLRDIGLEYAIKHIIFGETNKQINGNVELKEYIKLIREVAKEIHMIVDKTINRE